VAETISAYVAACSAGREITVAQQEVALQIRSTDLTKSRPRQPVRLEDQVRSSIPPLEAQRREALYRLALLIGQPPAEFPQSAASCAAEPKLNQPIPIGDGEELLSRRPDIRRAEYELHAATAQIGIATASLYPQITFGASIESVGPTSAFLDYSALKYSIGPLISWSFPNVHAAEDRIHGAKAGVQIAYTQFDGVVLNALRETESALTVYSHDLDQRALLQASRAHAATAAGDAQKLFSLGRENYLSVLDANLTLISTDQALAVLDAKISADQVTLFLALGGGWETSHPN
jgi:multidrug efflux system outer membrane protein